MYAAMIQMIFLEFVIHLTLNLMIYQKLILRNLLQLVFLRIKKTLKLSQLLILSMKILKLELKLPMVLKIMNLLYQEVVYFLKLHIFWLETVMNFMGPSQKNTFPEFLCFNQRHLVSVTLSLRCHVYFNFLVDRK